MLDRLAIEPGVAPGDQPGGAVGLGEIVERPHGVDGERLSLAGQRIDAVVGVKGLARFPGTDLDDHRGAKLIVDQEAVE